MKKFATSLRSAVSAAALLALAAGAQAGITDPGLIISASNDAGSGQYLVFLSNGTWSNGGTTWEWQSPVGGYDIFDPDTFSLVAHVDNMHCLMVADPQITVNFSVAANSSTTLFSITTGVLSFGTINTPFARASAGITITDGDGDGATLTGLHAGANAYRANYNGTIPAGTSYANLVGSFAAPIDDSNTNSGASPLVGYTAIGTPVSNMQAEFDFLLSANDTASGTSFYEIIPAPAGTMALGAAGLMALRRRRSN